MPSVRILVAEDEEAILTAIRATLVRIGYEVVTATSLSVALQRAVEKPPDLAIIDWVLEDGTGLALFQELKRRNPEIMGLLITGHSTSEGARQAEAIGFWDFLVKPFTIGELQSRVRKAVDFIELSRAKKRAEQMAGFYQKVLELVAINDPATLSRQLIALAKAEGQADLVSLMVRSSEDPQRLVIAAADGLPDDLVGQHVSVTEGVAGRVIAQAGSVLIAPDTLEQIRDWPLRYGGEGSALCLPLIVAGQVVGVLNVTRLQTPEPFSQSDLELFEILSRKAAEALARCQVFLRVARWGWLGFLSFARYAEQANPHRIGSAERVSHLTRRLAEGIGLSEGEVTEIALASLARDLGMVRIPVQVLTKPAPLTAEEWALVRKHPLWSIEILDPESKVPGAMRRGIVHHHERFSGSGYPEGLKGEQIPLEARIVSVADTFDALIHPRPYRQAFTRQQAIAELHRLAGEQLDPDLTDLFISRVIAEA